MSEIDLVPGYYRRLQRLRTTFRRVAVICVLALLCVGGARAGLVQGIEYKERELARLRTVRTGLLSQKARIKKLEADRARMERELEILEQLRGGTAAKQTLFAVDRALNGDVWFLSWTFHRAGEWVDEPPQTVHTGYFIIVPPEKGDETERTWRLRSHMEIRAQATSHSALASFVRDLVDQPEIEDVRVVNTRVHRYTSSQVVSFELAVVIKNRS